MTALIIKNLCYSYSEGRIALDNASIEIDAGMRVALIGKNGSGKSTLLLHIACLLDGDGYIEVMGIRRSRNTVGDIRNSIGFLFSQVEYQFIMPDLINDVMLGMTTGSMTKLEKIEKAKDWLASFDLAQYHDRSPLELSSGEMKRAALAGVMAKQPSLLLLDEPLNNLDRHNSEILINILKAQSATMLIATHNRFIVEELATHIAVMEKGRITAFHDRAHGLKMNTVSELLF
jgi:cobalt/nickel transport system ATP-binding protein